MFISKKIIVISEFIHGAKILNLGQIADNFSGKNIEESLYVSRGFLAFGLVCRTTFLSYEQLGIFTPKLFGLARTFDLFIYFSFKHYRPNCL